MRPVRVHTYELFAGHIQVNVQRRFFQFRFMVANIRLRTQKSALLTAAEYKPQSIVQFLILQLGDQIFAVISPETVILSPKKSLRMG